MDRANGNPKELLLQLVQENDLRRTNRFAMAGLGWLARTTLGEGPVLDGLDCTPTEGLNVEIAPGAIYKTAPVDAVAYGDLPADPHLILKQGLLIDPATLACPAPVTSGQSIAYLVQAALQEADIQEPDGEGPAETTVRADRCVVSVKAGEPAATGSQITPTPDEGKIGAWVVTVAYGQTAVSDITLYPGAPFLAVKLSQAAPLDSPVFSGDPQAPTPAAGDNDDSIATTAFVQGELLGVGAFFALKSGSITTPPATPATGDGYLVAQGATGAWEGHEGRIAIWRGADWRFIAAAEGVTVVLADTGLYYRRATTYWRALMADTAEHVAGEVDDLFANPAGVKAAQDAYLHGQEAVEPAPNDELLIYDTSAQTNRKITLAELISMPEFDTAEVGEIRPFAGQPNEDWFPCSGGTLLKAEYPELFDRIGQLYLNEVTYSPGFSSGLTNINSSVGFFAFGRYWLAAIDRGSGEDYRIYLDHAATYDGTPTRVISGSSTVNAARFAAPSFGPDYGVIPLGETPSRTSYVVFNAGMAAVRSLASPMNTDYSARIATDGTTYAYTSGANVFRKSVADFVAGTGSWSSITISGKPNDAFGIIYNTVSQQWVCASHNSVWVASTAAGPFVQVQSPPTTRIYDMSVLPDGKYLAMTAGGLYTSISLNDWATLKAGTSFATPASTGLDGSALVVDSDGPQLTDGNVLSGPIAGMTGSGWSSDGEGFVAAGYNLNFFKPTYDSITRFRLPKFATAVSSPPYFIKVK